MSTCEGAMTIINCADTERDEHDAANAAFDEAASQLEERVESACGSRDPQLGASGRQQVQLPRVGGSHPRVHRRFRSGAQARWRTHGAGPRGHGSPCDWRSEGYGSGSQSDSDRSTRRGSKGSSSKGRRRASSRSRSSSSGRSRWPFTSWSARWLSCAPTSSQR
jgi:hypothetical protein